MTPCGGAGFSPAHCPEQTGFLILDFSSRGASFDVIGMERPRGYFGFVGRVWPGTVLAIAGGSFSGGRALAVLTVPGILFEQGIVDRMGSVNLKSSAKHLVTIVQRAPDFSSACFWARIAGDAMLVERHRREALGEDGRWALRHGCFPTAIPSMQSRF